MSSGWKTQLSLTSTSKAASSPTPLSFGLEGRKCKELQSPSSRRGGQEGEGPARAAPGVGRRRTQASELLV